MDDVVPLTDTVEKLMDRHGLGTLLDTLALVCEFKADHVRANWQDAVLAGAWDRTAKDLDKVKSSVEARNMGHASTRRVDAK